MAMKIMNSYKPNSEIEKIHHTLIKKNKLNFFEIKNIDELKETILKNGLQHNLVVYKNIDNNYTLVSGERRFTAIQSLIKDGHKEFEYVDCKVIVPKSHDDEIESVIVANVQVRTLCLYEYLVSVKVLRKIYTENSEKGKVRDRIANTLNCSTGKVNTYIKILNNGSKTLFKMIKDNKVTLAQANKICELSVDQQDNYFNKGNCKQEKEDYSIYVNNLQNRFNTTVKMSSKSVSIKYKDENEMKRILELLEVI